MEIKTDRLLRVGKVGTQKLNTQNGALTPLMTDTQINLRGCGGRRPPRL